jgi:hypothetical protein
MTISEYTEQLQKQLKDEVARLNKEHQDRLTFLARVVPYTRDLIVGLQQFVHQYKFSGPEEEIQFFKEQKPVLLSQYFYYYRALSIFIYDSYKDIESRRIYYNSVLVKLERFVRKHNRFHMYCRTGERYLDEKYFMREGQPSRIIIDMQSSTGYDVRLARLLANELLRTEIILCLANLSAGERNSSLNWTGKKSDAVELLFALHAAGSINGGQVDIKKLASAFEQFFNVQLGNYYDFVKKIRMRKGNQTSYLDAMKENLLVRLREMDQ